MQEADSREKKRNRKPLSNSTAIDLAGISDGLVIKVFHAFSARVEVNEGNLFWGFRNKRLWVYGMRWRNNDVVSFRVIIAKVYHLSSTAVIKGLFFASVELQKKSVFVSDGLKLRVFVN